MYKLFTFYHTNDDSKCIHVAALTFLEATNAVYELDNFAPIHYNFKEYKMEHINAYEYLNIDTDYWQLPYILSEKEYKQVIKAHKKAKKELSIGDIVRHEVDESQKYNTAIPLRKSEFIAEDALNRISRANEKCKIRLDNKIQLKDNTNKEIEIDPVIRERLKNFKQDANEILLKYMHQFNNKETRDNISDDMYNLIKDKYADLMNCIDETVEKNNENDILNKLKNNIKGED